MKMDITLDEKGVGRVSIVIENEADLDKIYDIKYHVGAILKTMNKKPEDEDED